MTQLLDNFRAVAQAPVDWSWHAGPIWLASFFVVCGLAVVVATVVGPRHG